MRRSRSASTMSRRCRRAGVGSSSGRFGEPAPRGPLRAGSVPGASGRRAAQSEPEASAPAVPEASAPVTMVQAAGLKRRAGRLVLAGSQQTPRFSRRFPSSRPCCRASATAFARRKGPCTRRDGTRAVTPAHDRDRGGYSLARGPPLPSREWLAPPKQGGGAGSRSARASGLASRRSSPSSLR